MKTIKVELRAAVLIAAMGGVATVFGGGRIPPATRGWPFGFQLLPRRRRCQLCAEPYTEDPPLPGRGYSDHPPVCADCKQVIDRVAENMSGKFGMPISTEAVAGLIGHRTAYEPIRYGGHWQDLVPAHSRHLIKGKP